MVQENEEFKTVVNRKRKGKTKIIKENLSNVVPGEDDHDFDLENFKK